jgi:hypothetical protein
LDCTIQWRKSAQAIAFDIAEDAPHVDVFKRHALWFIFLPDGAKPLTEFAGLGLEFRVRLQLLLELHFLLHELFVGHGGHGGGAGQRHAGAD